MQVRRQQPSFASLISQLSDGGKSNSLPFPHPSPRILSAAQMPPLTLFLALAENSATICANHNIIRSANMAVVELERPIDADKALKALGTWGKYQLWIFTLANIPWIFIAFQMMSIAFTGATPPFDCVPSPSHSEDYSLPNATDFYLKRCKYTDNSTMIDEDQLDQTCGVNQKSHFIYETEQFGETITSEWNLVCENKVMNKVASSSFFMGKLLGSLIFPSLADRYGRRWFVLSCSWALGLLGLLVAFSPNYWVFVTLRLFTGAVAAGAAVANWVLCCEVVVPSKRSYTVTGQGVFWMSGYCLVGVYAYFWRDWRSLQVALSLTTSVLIAYYWLIPESLHWHVAMKQYDKAWEWIERAAKCNNCIVKPADVYETKTRDEGDREQHRRTLLDIGKSPILLVQTAIMAYLWFINTAFYYGLSLFTAELVGDRYTNFILSGAVELPAYFLLNPMLSYIGRRGTIGGFHALASVALLILMFIPPTTADGTSLQAVATGFWLLGKFAISSSFMGVWLYGAEIFPTTVRTSGVGLCNVAARAGGILAPFASMLNEFFETDKAVPTVFSIFSFLAAALIVLLPETANRDLPEDIHQIDYALLGTCIRKKHKADPISAVDAAEFQPLTEINVEKQSQIV